MKKGKILGIIALSAIILTGCGKNNRSNPSDSNMGGSDNSSNSSEISATPLSNADLTGWSNEEKQAIITHAYGADIPYYHIDNESKLAYDEELESLVKTAPVCTSRTLASYAALFDSSWKNYSTAETDDAADYGYYYSFEKKIATSAGNRYIDVYFYGAEYDADNEEYLPTTDGTGIFYMTVYDPYYYSWPTDLVTYILTDYFEVSDTVPAFTAADHYQPSFDSLFYGYFALFAYTPNKASQSNYAQTLLNAGYKSAGTSDDGYACYESPNGELSVEILYDEDYQDLDIYICLADGSGSGTGGEDVETYTSWPTNAINQLTKDYLNTTETCPAYTGGDEYIIETDYLLTDECLYVIVFTDETNAETKYASALTNAGYTYRERDEYGYTCYTSPKGTLSVDYCYDEEYEQLYICIYAFDGGSGSGTGGDIVVPVGENADILTIESLGVKVGTSDYLDYSFTSKTTGVRYSVIASSPSSKSTAFQLRGTKANKTNSGIVAYCANGYCLSITFEGGEIYDTRDILIYGSNTAFTVDDLHGSLASTNIAKLTISEGETLSYQFTGQYKYVGIKIDSGAAQFESITFDWDI